MTSGLGAEGLDKLLTDTRQLLDTMRTAPPPDPEPLTGTGTALDGSIRVTVTSPGRLTELELEPRVLRLQSAELSRHLIEAVNQALDELRRRAVAAVAPADLHQLSGQLAQLQDESIRQMEKFTSAIGGAIEAIRRRP